jgi:hypothetical protein
LWRLNVAGLLEAALERSPDGVVDRRVARELLTEWFAEHPEERKSATGPRWKRKRKREGGGQNANADERSARVGERDPARAALADMTGDELLAAARRIERRGRRS